MASEGGAEGGANDGGHCVGVSGVVGGGGGKEKKHQNQYHLK